MLAGPSAAPFVVKQKVTNFIYLFKFGAEYLYTY